VTSLFAIRKAADAGASALIYGGQVPVAAQNLGDGPLNGTVPLSYQSTSEKHEANVGNLFRRPQGTIWFSWRMSKSRKPWGGDNVP
jgi:hypothetical protein